MFTSMILDKMKIEIENYLEQEKRWPQEGRHILAQYDDESIIVYQAYRKAIANYALKHGRFGGPFSFERMTWIKPNFLWMMYRSGWGTKNGQEYVLAIRLKRSFFNRILSEAVKSSYADYLGYSHEIWKEKIAASSVRLQWDPDHEPGYGKLERKAIQIGMRNDVVKEYVNDAILEIININDFVEEQRENNLKDKYKNLMTPKEKIYYPGDKAAQNVGLSKMENL